MNTVQDEWVEFRRLAIHEEACDGQVDEMKKAYYAGVFTVMKMQLALMDRGYSEAASIAITEGWWDECESLFRSYVEAQ